MVFFGWMDGVSSARLSASFIIVVGGNPQDSQISPPVLCVKWRLVGDSEGVRHHGLARVPQMPLALAHQKTKTAVCFECAGLCPCPYGVCASHASGSAGGMYV